MLSLSVLSSTQSQTGYRNLAFGASYLQLKSSTCTCVYKHVESATRRRLPWQPLSCGRWQPTSLAQYVMRSVHVPLDMLTLLIADEAEIGSGSVALNMPARQTLKRLKACHSRSRELYLGLICHTGSCIVTCRPTQVNAFRFKFLIPAMQAAILFA